jgi:small-conductance mechanosensitive channel
MAAEAQSQTGSATVEFSQSRYTMRPNARTAEVALRRSGNTNTAVSVDFATADETAIAGIHYAARTGPINFAPGQIEETIRLPLLAGPREDEDKLFRLVLNHPSEAALLGPNTVAEVVLPKLRNTAWLNFGLDRIEPLRETLFEIPLWQYLASFIYIFLAFYISKLLDVLIRGKLRQWALKSSTRLDDLLLELLRGPIKVVAFVILLHIGLRVFAWPDWLSDFISKALRIIVAISLTYMALRFIDLLTNYWKQRISGHEDRPFSEQLLPIIRNSLKVFTVIVAVLLTLQNLGLNVTSLIASLSIGGLALSLAAQDTLSNLFGAVAILTDKPFLVGDRIKLEQVDGVVDSVGLRSTRVRTVEGNLVSIPNKTMGNAIVTKFAAPPSVPQPPEPPLRTA